VEDREFYSLDEVTSHIHSNVDYDKIQGDLSVIGSVSDFRGREEFVESLQPHFSIEKQSGDLYLLNSRKLDVPYYVYVSEEFPIFLTTGRKTQDFPETIDAYLKAERNIGRMWISKTDMEDLRQQIIREYPEVIIPYFTASRSKHSEIQARRRPRHKRTIQYYGNDGRETFEEMKYEYGVLPTNLKFQRANEFKLRVTTRGVFTIKDGGLEEVFEVIEDSIERLKEVKNAIDDSGFTFRTNKFNERRTMPLSRPWAIQLSESLDGADARQFEDEEALNEWEFDLGDIDYSFIEGRSYFSAEFVDERTLGKTILRSKDGAIRVYPREETGIDQSLRVFEFLNDQIDPNSYATPVV
jgi:hypothetical protein